VSSVRGAAFELPPPAPVEQYNAVEFVGSEARPAHPRVPLVRTFHDSALVLVH
jgi:hypothetical protein